jgi:hypothetical protein
VRGTDTDDEDPDLSSLMVDSSNPGKISKVYLKRIHQSKEFGLCSNFLSTTKL